MSSYLQIINQAKNSWIKCFILLPSGKRPLRSQVWGSIRDWVGILHWPLAPGPWSPLSCPVKSLPHKAVWALAALSRLRAYSPLMHCWQCACLWWKSTGMGLQGSGGILWAMGAGNPKASRAWGTRFWLKRLPWPISSCRKGHSWRRAEQAVSSKA